MVEIPAGSFCMGSPDGVGESDEHPQHQVSVHSFYMGKYEVTQAQYRAVMGINPSYFTGCEECPVETVSWDGAQAFIRKLNGMQNRYTYRLPSEAEWEYAARADLTGDSVGEVDSKAWYFENSGDNHLNDADWDFENIVRNHNRTHPIGQKKSNSFGLYDMYGNVWEWCEDWWHDSYNGAPVDGSVWVNVRGQYQVLRGGSWGLGAEACRSAQRNIILPGNSGSDLGFRVAASSR